MQAAETLNGSPLQLTHMVLGNVLTSIPAIKQAIQVRNEVYRAPVDRVAVDTAKKSVVCELIVPENQRNQTIREIGLLEHETLMAIGYASSRYTPMQQKDGSWIYIVHIPLENIPASAIETVDNLISLEVSDTRYLDAAENLKDVTNKNTARDNLGLGSAAVKNAGTGNTDLITTGDADSRYLNAADNLSDLPDKIIARTNLGLGDAATKKVGVDDNDLVTAANALISRSTVQIRGSDINGDLNKLFTPGIYCVGFISEIAILKNNFPEGISKSGFLLVLRGDSSNYCQIYIEGNNSKGIFWRNKWSNGSNWTSWHELITDENADNRYLKNSENLANNTTARTKLGLGTAALKDAGTGNTDLITTGDADSRYLNAADNLSDLPDKIIARTNLGLGDAATKKVGVDDNDLVTAANALISRSTVQIRGSDINGDLNKLFTPGIYCVGFISEIAILKNNFPEGISKSGFLLVLRGDSSNYCQIYIEGNNSKGIFWRNKWSNGSNWTSWHELITDENADNRYLKNSENLANNTTARTKLGLGTAALKDAGTGNTDLITTGDADSRYLNAADNLSDLSNKTTARTNLELGTAATKEVGTGDDQLVTGKDALVRRSFKLIVDGDLDNLITPGIYNPGVVDRIDIIKKGLPTGVSSSAGFLLVLRNSEGGNYCQFFISDSTSGKAVYYRNKWVTNNWQPWCKLITDGNYKDDFSANTNGYQKFPSGLIMQWGKAQQTTRGQVMVTWPMPFPSTVLSVTATPILINPKGEDCIGIDSYTKTGATFYRRAQYDNGLRVEADWPFLWQAVGH